MPGIEFHANMLESLFQNVSLRPIDSRVSSVVLTILTLGTFLVAVYASVWIITSVFVLLPIIVVFVSWYLMAAEGLVLDVWSYCFVAGIASLI